MTRIELVLRRALADLEGLRIPFAVVGGLAVSARTEPRFTRDVDLAVSVSTDADAEGVVYELQQRGYVLTMLLEQEQTGRIATARFVPPGEDEEGVIVDLLFQSSGLEPEVVKAAEPVELTPDVVAPVARTGHLMLLKLLARDDERRPQDAGDIVALREHMSTDEIALSRHGANLIVERGCSRGRDLLALLEEQLQARD